MDAELRLWRLLELRAAERPDALAIVPPAGEPLTYAALASRVFAVAESVQAARIDCSQRVAVVLPEGPANMVAILGVSAAAACAPLNPSCRAEEFEFAFADLGVRAAVLAPGDSAARQAARKLGIAALDPEPRSGLGDRERLARPDDVAVVMRTSGTTARPKIVPLLQRNLASSALAFARDYELTPEDRALIPMPLFHIHGLMTTLAALVSGGSLVAMRGFRAPDFFTLLERHRPTWYSAAPAIHQAIIAEAPRHLRAIAAARLRFLRSSAAPLPPQWLHRLEEIFGAPMLEGYGMSETALHATSNPPGARKPGSVGVPRGAEVVVADEDGRPLGAGQTGEILFRGPGVIPRYDGGDEINRAAFIGGWLRSGDTGYFDEDGYLFVTGRLKEVINRGGEKISPREIDEVLLDHPAVSWAVTFPVAHPTLGEEVAAAVLLREGMAATERELTAFVRARLAFFKTPKRIAIRKELPRGAIGKVRRAGLAEALGITLAGEDTAAPSTPTERRLASIWREILGSDRAGIHDDFFQSGGDSLLAAQFMVRATAEFGREIPFLAFLDDPTIAALARAIDAASGAHDEPGPGVVVMQPGDGRPPLYCVHAVNGAIQEFAHLARRLDPGQGVFALAAPAPGDYSLEDLASRHVRTLLRARPEGPYLLAGSCFGGVVAYEMARQLEARGREVSLVAMFDSFNHDWKRRQPRARLAAAIARHFFRRVVFHARGFLSGGVPYLRGRVEEFLWTRRVAMKEDLRIANTRALMNYGPGAYGGRVVLFHPPAPRPGAYPDDLMGWRGLAEVELREVPGEHLTLFDEPNAGALARELSAAIARATQSSESITILP
jgi:acyl-CoA synthetase (AMP-forming)/AMP-acid ligase II/thioesterase domain-containing protein/acyl carrier protein